MFLKNVIQQAKSAFLFLFFSIKRPFQLQFKRHAINTILKEGFVIRFGY
jgi:hypothetical protein